MTAQQKLLKENLVHTQTHTKGKGKSRIKLKAHRKKNTTQTKKKQIFGCIFPQDEIGNNFDQFGSMKENLDFHLDTSAWEFANKHDISHGLFRVKNIFFSSDK